MTDTPLETKALDVRMPTTFIGQSYVPELAVGVAFEVELVDRQPMISMIQFTEPVHPDRLDGIDWAAAVDLAVGIEAFRAVTGGTGTFGDMANPRTMTAVRHLAGRHKVADETIVAAAAAHRRGGLQRIVTELKVSQRTAQRYLKRARDLELVTE